MSQTMSFTNLNNFTIADCRQQSFLQGGEVENQVINSFQDSCALLTEWATKIEEANHAQKACRFAGIMSSKTVNGGLGAKWVTSGLWIIMAQYKDWFSCANLLRHGDNDWTIEFVCAKGGPKGLTAEQIVWRTVNHGLGFDDSDSWEAICAVEFQGATMVVEPMD